MTKLIAITIGDIKGVGIKILINSWKSKHIKNFILFTDYYVLIKYLPNKKFIKNINIIDLKKSNLNYLENKINIYSYKSNSLEHNTYKSLKVAYQFCSKKICRGIITLPLRKDLIKDKIDKKFIGHTEYFQKIDNKKYSNMILVHNKIIVSPMTTHVRLNNVTKQISKKEFLFNQIVNLNKTLKIDFKINKPNLIISGINPHAGENGKIGNEEIKFIIPTIKKLQNNGVNISGPESADSILIKKNLNKYDCFIFIYHDQALIPFKFISQFNGVNYTGNLDIIRTSPDHGTAYNLKNIKEISNKSFINCFKLINKIYRNRIMNDKS